MLLAHRGQTVGLVRDRVLLGADPEEASVEQTHRGGQHALARRLVAGLEVRGDALAQLRKRAGEARHVFELLGIAPSAPGGVVAVLLAPGRVDAGRLKMPARVGADPHVAPRRWDAEIAD